MSTTRVSRKLEHVVYVNDELQVCEDGMPAAFGSKMTARHYVRETEGLTLDEDRAPGFAVGYRDEDMEPIYIRGRWSA